MRSQTFQSRRHHPQGGSLIAGALGLVVGLLVTLIMACLWMVALLFKPIPFKRPHRPAEPTRAEPVPVEDDMAEAEMQEVANRVLFRKIGEDAKLHCRLYQARRQIECKVVSRSDRARAVFGQCELIDTASLDDCSLEMAAQRAEARIRERLDRHDAKAGTTAQTTACPETGTQAQGDDANGPNEAFSGSTRRNPTGHTKRVIQPPKEGVVRYRGALVEAGVKPRPGRGYESYSVALDDESLGSVQELWGADLERALAESGAAIGDRIELALLGESPTVVKGKTVRKKIWAAAKL